MADEYVIDVQGLNKSFADKKAVIDLSLKVKRGEIFGFLGPNGSGKTTTIRMLCGLMMPDAGQGTCFNYNILEHSPMIKKLVGYVPQTFSLYQDLTVQENLEFIARIYGEKDYSLRTQQMMMDLKLTPYANSYAGKLSGGWKQRLSLGAALIHHPQLLLLDEPTAGVDPKARREFWNDITRLAAQGITVLLSTHYMDEAERCNRLAYLVSGRLMAEGTIHDIIEDAQLITFAARGQKLGELAHALQDKPGIEQVVVLGNEVRICGGDEKLLEKTIAFFPGFSWKRVKTSLEEVFIHLVNESLF